MRSGFVGLWIVLALLPGCSSKPAMEEGNVKVTATADLGKLGRPGK